MKEKGSKAERRAAHEADRAAKGAAKSLKGTTSKAERRAIQEAERAAKAAAKGAYNGRDCFLYLLGWLILMQRVRDAGIFSFLKKNL